MKKPTEQTPYVFVYGTLMSGFGNNRLLKDSAMIDYASTEDEYVLVSNGVIPYLMDDVKDSYIIGEVYEVNEKTLKNLDDLEGHPNWYQRRIINVVSDVGDRLRAWAYFMPVKPQGAEVIELGDYKSYTQKVQF
jgi:gamma-glutamylaminecyclotransferase